MTALWFLAKCSCNRRNKDHEQTNQKILIQTTTFTEIFMYSKWQSEMRCHKKVKAQKGKISSKKVIESYSIQLNKRNSSNRIFLHKV